MQMKPSSFTALRVLRRWLTTHGRRQSLLLASGTATLLAVIILTGAVDRSVSPIDIGLTEIQPSDFVVKIQQNGVVEPMHSTVVNSACYWSTNILSIVPEGTWVQAGDVVCVLDSA